MIMLKSGCVKKSFSKDTFCHEILNKKLQAKMPVKKVTTKEELHSQLEDLFDLHRFQK